VERRRFFECILRDSVAVVEFAASLEREVKAGATHWWELSASDRLNQIRTGYDHNKGTSFDTISASGPNGAVIHYRPAESTNRRITTSEMYLLDSGGQYLDGTTDVTRTFHFGTPRDIEKEAYTRVLMGSIDLATTVWPDGLYGRDIDARARSPIWQNGWEYNHGTGHGIGYFMSVHEGPGRINIGYDPNHRPLQDGMFFSDEPGYYEDGEFGVRLETLVGVVKVQTPNNFGGRQYLGFLPATLVPFEPNLIKYDLLTKEQKVWLNYYHDLCRTQVGQYLQTHRPNNQTARDWLMLRTEPVPISQAPPTLTFSLVTLALSSALALVTAHRRH
jgi:Xaa-Pro aminopeptidase